MLRRFALARQGFALSLANAAVVNWFTSHFGVGLRPSLRPRQWINPTITVHPIVALLHD